MCRTPGARSNILMEQKSRSLARKGIADIFAPPGHREFYLDLASNPELRHLIHISRVEIGTVCAAANLGIVFGDCYYHVLASYVDSEVAHYGPGALHLRELMAHAISWAMQRFDFTIGDEPYKLEWSDTVLKLYDYTATRTWRGLPARWFSSGRRRVKRWIKQTPALWTLASHARSAIGSLSRPSRSDERQAVFNTPPAPKTLACVMGDMDLLRPLALAGIPCAVVSRPGVPSLYSRYAQSCLVWHDYADNIDGLLDTLMRFGKAQGEPPVLFYEEDGQILLVSRHRQRLAQAFRFVAADATLRRGSARQGALPGFGGTSRPAGAGGAPLRPRGHRAGRTRPSLPAHHQAADPARSLERYVWIAQGVVRGKHRGAARLWPQLRAVGLELLAQEFVPGTEARIENYHCYVDAHGRIAGEFTGRKIRTYPLSYGHTTALEITDAADVRRLGRDIVER